jgi:hypothetical protein
MFGKRQNKTQAQKEPEAQESEHVHVWDEIKLAARYPGGVTLLRRCREQACGVRQVKKADEWYPITLTNYGFVLLRENELAEGIMHCPKCDSTRISEYIGIKSMYRCDNCRQLFHREDFLQMSTESVTELQKKLTQLERFVIQLFEKKAAQPVPLAAVATTTKNQMPPQPPDRTKEALENFEKVLPKEAKQIEEARQQGDKAFGTPKAKIKGAKGTAPEKLDRALPVLDTPAELELDRPVGQVSGKGREELDRAPSRAELDELKRALLLSSGSLIFKHGAIYLVTCERKKHHWKRLGAWEKLKRKTSSALEE